MQQKPVIDIFCHVIDNLGDVGVTWRLARQLVAEKNVAVRLIVDDFSLFPKMAPDIDISLFDQEVDGVRLLRWDEATLPASYSAPGVAVIEAFGCTLPPFVLDLMVQHKTVWIDLEYLSAENWVDGFHAVVSLHPMTGLNKTLFFPGFTAQTGGLFREENLLQQRDDFQDSPVAQNAWRARHGLPDLSAETTDISLFCYKNAPFEALLAGLQGRQARVFATPEIAALLLQHEIGDVGVFSFNYMPQDDFDRLLWTCDLNFVRGEDSFLRALWAGRPYIWQIYTQEEGAHFAKLDAFLRHYSQNLEPQDAEDLAEMTGMWNLRGINAGTVAGFLDRLPYFAEFSRKRAADQATQDDLATQLLRFIDRQNQEVKAKEITE